MQQEVMQKEVMQKEVMQKEVTIPGGKEKDKRVIDASDATLKYWSENGRDAVVRDACAAEIDRRAGKAPRANGGAPTQQTARQQSANRASPLPKGADGFLFKGDDPAAVTAWFHEHRDEFHLVTPASVVQSLPEGFEVAISTIYVNPHLEAGKKTNGDVYEVEGGGLGLGATVLAKISAAAGISWDTRQSGQVDTFSHPHFVQWHVVAGYRLFDGTAIVDGCSKTLDLRDGSARIEGKTEKWVRAQRENIYEMAETKAKNRFIRRLGLKSNYTVNELEGRPFAVARLMFTGRTRDPELRRMFALLKAQEAMGGAATLFGPERAPLALGSASVVQQQGRPVHELPAARDDDSAPWAAVPSLQRSATPEPTAAQPQAQTAAAPAQAPAPQAAPASVQAVGQQPLLGDEYGDRDLANL